jgi:hypothetical protein
MSRWRGGHPACVTEVWIESHTMAWYLMEQQVVSSVGEVSKRRISTSKRQEIKMGFLDKLLGREEPQEPQRGGQQFGYDTRTPRSRPDSRTTQQITDEQALARYRYMLQTAPPEALEQAHEEAFSKLTPEQRRMALEQLAEATPENERGALSDDPRSMARAATRAEMRLPGTMERTFGGGGMGMGGLGMGGMMAGSILTSIAGGFIGSAIANSFFNNPAVAQDYTQSDTAQAAGDTDMSAGDPYGDPADVGGADPYGDPAGSDGGDPYGDPADSGGDAGGDFGGGDFGGGDFGGGDFGGDFGGGDF